MSSNSISPKSTALVLYDPTLPHVALRTGKARALEKQLLLKKEEFSFSWELPLPGKVL